MPRAPRDRLAPPSPEASSERPQSGTLAPVDSLSLQRAVNTRRALFAVSATGYALCATPGAFWLDSSELAGAGITLGIPHAPGHPVYVILAYAASLLPVGAIGFRVALLSALLAAAAVALTHALVCELLDEDALWGRRAPDLSAAPAPPLWPATLAAVALGLSQAVWLQSVRAEVYTLELALALGLLLVAIRWHRVAPPRSAAPPLAVAFALGLGAGNHHLLLLAAVPALALLLLADPSVRSAPLRRVPPMALATLWGLAAYALLPLRAAGGPLINYGDPSSLSRLVDMVTARVFMRSVSAAHSPLTDNLAAALDMFGAALGPLLLALSVIGLGLLTRRRPLLGAAMALVIAGNLATKVSMDLDPTNPDAAGYFQLGIAAAAALAALPFAALARHAQPLARLGGAAVGAMVVALLVTDALFRLPRTDLSRYDSPATLDTVLTRRVAPDALVLTSFFALHFNRLYQHAAEGARPDVLCVHQGFEDHVEQGRPLADRLRARDPRLAPALDQFLATRAFPTEALLAHAAERPVYLEPTFALPVPPSRLAYAGGLFRVLPPGSRPEPRLAEQAADQELLLRLARSEFATQREARTTLVILWLQLAVVRLQQGVGPGAALALDLVEAISPNLPQLAALRPLATGMAQAQGPTARAAAQDAVNAYDFARLFQ
jgi:hypothetical protein